jgi:hypothetical protein
MMYLAVLKQDGGCDYTIACGEKTELIIANSDEEAIQDLTQRIEENYSGMETSLDSCELYRISEVAFDLKAINDAISQKNKDAIAKRKEAEEKAEFERLKKKFS